MSTDYLTDRTVLNATTILPILMQKEALKMMFKWFDYFVFGGMLTVSVAIGIYFGFFSKQKQNTTEEYLLGGKNMQVIPIALSLVASYISGLTLLGVPADVYMFGGNYMLICIASVIATLVTSYVFLPVFFKLEVLSAYEYLKVRFDERVRIFASVLFTLSMVMYIPVVIYLPALALSQASGINKHLITPVLCVICIFYTAIGGIKAVVWTDSVQMVLMVTSTVAVFILGLSSAGGVETVWTKAQEGDRVNFFDFDIDLTKRDSFWILVFGTIPTYIYQIGLAQSQVQRILSVSNTKKAKRALFLFGIGVVMLIASSTFTGLIIYAIYSGCDPVMTKQVERQDQLLPHYIIDVSSSVPGLPGIFLAGMFSASLSTLSTTLNTLAGTIYQDIICPIFHVKNTEKQASNILKIIVVIAGIVCTLLVFVVEQLGGVLPLAISLGGIPAAPSVGLFLMGMLFPFANSKGALYGGITGMIFITWVVCGAQYYTYIGKFGYEPKPISIDDCKFHVNLTTDDTTISTSIPAEEEQIFILYRISYYCYTLMGTIATMVVGLLVSWFTSKDDPPVERDAICPLVHFLMPKNKTPYRTEYLTVEKALLTLKSTSGNEVEPCT